MIWPFIIHVTGTKIGPSGSYWYNFWSGFGSDFGEVSILSAMYLWYNHRKCVSCRRIAKYEVEGTGWKTCHKHLTATHHDRLHAEHAVKHPEQHAMLNNTKVKLASADTPVPAES